MSIHIELVGAEQHDAFTRPLLTAFGLRFDSDRAARSCALPELVQRIAAKEGDKIVGSAGGFLFEMTTPGGSVPISGLTMVGVLPTHRRRGVLSSMIRKHFDQARDNGQPVSALWASEGSIYGRYGYGVASLSGSISIERDRAAFKRPAPREGELRLLDEKEALAPFREVWERVRPTVPGMLSRSDAWWANRRLGDFEKGPLSLQRAALYLDGRPEGYAIYRFVELMPMPGVAEANLSVVEAVATSPRATAALWRYIFDLDLVRRIEAPLLNAAHPLFHMVAEPRRLRMQVGDAVWVRLVDAAAALGARAFAPRGAVAFKLDDAFCPWNEGVYRIEDGRASRWEGAPDLRFNASALGSLYMGGVTARQLADAGEIEELSEGAVDRADALFRWPRAPWCPDIF
jgi:predicted acetyltransferase